MESTMFNVVQSINVGCHKTVYPSVAGCHKPVYPRVVGCHKLV